MCGRFALGIPKKNLAEWLEADLPDYAPRHNIPPGTDVLAVIMDSGGKRLGSFFRWGFLPVWADPGQSRRPINTRAEGLFDKPFFRQAARSRRCLVPARGFFEWKREDGGKRPFYLTGQGDEPLAMAGIWEAARDGEPACLAVVTCPAGPDVAPIHDRQPVLVPRKRWDDWLAPGTDRETLERVSRPSPADSLLAWEVSRAVNDPANDGPELLRPVKNGPARRSLLE